MKKIKSERVHDVFYAEEDHFTEPKEYFKEAINLIKKNSNIFESKENEKKTILDIGCAAGDFLRYLESKLNKNLKVELHGIDIMDKLLIEAKKRVKKAQFKKIDIGNKKQNLEKIFNKKYDLITMFGVSSIFDDFIWLDNIFTGLKVDGFALLFCIYNPYPYDVILRVKKSESDNWEPGWNVISKKSIESYCKKNNFSAKFIDFEPDISISPNEKDGLRSWTIDLGDNQKIKNNTIPIEQTRKRIFTSANRLIYDWSFCIIKKND